MKTPIPTDADCAIIAKAMPVVVPLQTLARWASGGNWFGEERLSDQARAAWRAILAERARVRREKANDPFILKIKNLTREERAKLIEDINRNSGGVVKFIPLDQAKVSAGLESGAKAVGCRVGVADAKMFYGRGRISDAAQAKISAAMGSKIVSPDDVPAKYRQHLGMAAKPPKARKP